MKEHSAKEIENHTNAGQGEARRHFRRMVGGVRVSGEECGTWAHGCDRL